ncbi:uncharacterized protein V6R79_025230 [Siganus canaliculatus]
MSEHMEHTVASGGTTSLPVCSNLSQSGAAKRLYAVHSAIFVVAPTAPGAGGRGSSVDSSFCRCGPRGTRAALCRPQSPQCSAAAGGGHTNSGPCGKKRK